MAQNIQTYHSFAALKTSILDYMKQFPNSRLTFFKIYPYLCWTNETRTQVFRLPIRYADKDFKDNVRQMVSDIRNMKKD